MSSKCAGGKEANVPTPMNSKEACLIMHPVAFRIKHLLNVGLGKGVRSNDT